MSGRFDYFHLSLGIISCAIVAHISHDLLFKDIKAKNRHIEVIRFIKYLPWLFYQIVLANLHVAYLALHPGMPKLIDPHIIMHAIDRFVAESLPGDMEKRVGHIFMEN